MPTQAIGYAQCSQTCWESLYYLVTWNPCVPAHMESF